MEMIKYTDFLTVLPLFLSFVAHFVAVQDLLLDSQLVCLLHSGLAISLYLSCWYWRLAPTPCCCWRDQTPETSMALISNWFSSRTSFPETSLSYLSAEMTAFILLIHYVVEVVQLVKLLLSFPWRLTIAHPSSSQSQSQSGSSSWHAWDVMEMWMMAF